MRRRTWILTALAGLAILGGSLVFFTTNGTARPTRNEVGTPEARKAGPFDGERAMKYLTTICDLGPRISASEGMEKQQALIKKHFEDLGAKVTYQKFDGKQPSQPKAVPMVNIIVSFHPDAKTRLMICGHYDTRPIADQETNVRNWRKPFVSANDGGSSVAFMMELGNHIKDLKPELGVDFVLFDGEEFIHDRNNDKFFLGSEYFASEYRKGSLGVKYKAAILLDLFAGKGAVYPVEQNSAMLAGPLVEDVWKIAAELKMDMFVQRYGHNVLDDHIALNRAGIPAIDIIDFDYDHWHRLSDTPDKCSAESMANVAAVLMEWLRRTK